MDHTDYLKRRDEFLKIRTDSFNSFDKAVLSLATGSLALSITFLDKIGAPFNKLTYIFIFITWASLFVVILANLLSYLFAKSNMDRKIDELDDKYKAEIKAPPTTKEAAEKIFWQRRATNICNNIAFVTFFVSIIFFISYIVAIQIHNYDQAQLEKKEEAGMLIKKPTPLKEIIAGATEAKAPVARKVITEGATETPALTLDTRR
jgi:hypothetical protein